MQVVQETRTQLKTKFYFKNALEARGPYQQLISCIPIITGAIVATFNMEDGFLNASSLIMN